MLGQAWPELLHALFQASQSADPAVRECAFRIFTTTPGIIEKQHEGLVQEVFGKGFRDDSSSVGWITTATNGTDADEISRSNWRPWKPLPLSSTHCPRRHK